MLQTIAEPHPQQEGLIQSESESQEDLTDTTAEETTQLETGPSEEEITRKKESEAAFHSKFREYLPVVLREYARSASETSHQLESAQAMAEGFESGSMSPASFSLIVQEATKNAIEAVMAFDKESEEIAPTIDQESLIAETATALQSMLDQRKLQIARGIVGSEEFSKHWGDTGRDWVFNLQERDADQEAVKEARKKSGYFLLSIPGNVASQEPPHRLYLDRALYGNAFAFEDYVCCRRIPVAHLL